jgi:hypothetical protein
MAVTQPELAPIIIGTSGACELQGKDSAVAASLAAIFDCLDERYPSTPKLLLTALAQGADILAAKGVLERTGWTIVAALPLPWDRYLQGFDDHAALTLRALIEAARARKMLRLFTLEPLRDEAGPRPAASGDPAHSPPTASPERTDHCEQARLFIASRCAVLVTAMPLDANTDRDCDISRVMRYRLSGEIDGAARHVIRRSHVLEEPAPLEAALVGPVWLVDPGTGDLSPEENAKGRFTVLLPSDKDIRPTERLRESLRLPDYLNEFNRRAQRLDAAMLSEIAGACRTMERPSSTLCGLMHALSIVQTGMNQRHKMSVWLLACLFFVAIVMFEVQADLNAQWGTIGYIGALISGIAVYKLASQRGWQSFAEDYRAIAESLRVQIAWWNCGLVTYQHRVDNFYLRDTKDSLALVRATIRHMIDAAWFLSVNDRPTVEPARDTRMASPSVPNKREQREENDGSRWIDEQIAYFANRLRRRQVWVSFIDASSWFLIVTSLVPQVLYAVNATIGDLLKPVLEAWLAPLPSGLVFMTTIAIVLSMFVVSSVQWLHPPGARLGRIVGTFEMPNLAVPAIAGTVLAIGLYDSVAFVRPERASGALLLLGGLTVASVGSAMQFVSSQLSWAEELNGYEDALGIFREARSALKDIDELPVDRAERTALRHTIIHALGKEALKEGEGWLRAHRRRPLEPLPPV